MLRVKTVVKQSSISGLGLFAVEPIERGRVTWVFDATIDQRIGAEDLNRLPEVARQFLVRYGFFSKDGATLFHCADDLRFINHSAAPNIGSTPFKDRALRDIAAGEELTCDYAAYEADWFSRRDIDPASFL